MFSQQDIEKVQTDCKQNIITGAQAYTLEDILTNIKSNIETNTHSLLEKLKNIQLYSTIGILIIQSQSTDIVVRTPGQKVLQDNKFFRDLVRLMNTEAFTTFKKRHMRQDLHSSLIYFELYSDCRMGKYLQGGSIFKHRPTSSKSTGSFLRRQA